MSGVHNSSSFGQVLGQKYVDRCNTWRWCSVLEPSPSSPGQPLMMTQRIGRTRGTQTNCSPRAATSGFVRPVRACVLPPQVDLHDRDLNVKHTLIHARRRSWHRRRRHPSGGARKRLLGRANTIQKDVDGQQSVAHAAARGVRVGRSPPLQPRRVHREKPANGAIVPFTSTCSNGLSPSGLETHEGRDLTGLRGVPNPDDQGGPKRRPRTMDTGPAASPHPRAALVVQQRLAR